MTIVSIVVSSLLILAIPGSINLIFLIYTEATQINLTSQDKFIIQNTSSFIDENSIIHVYGEIRNISNVSLDNVTAKGTFYDSNKELLNVYQRSCELPTVKPKEMCPFEILYLDTSTTKIVREYKLSALGTPTLKSKPTAMKVYYDNSRLDILGFYYINGKVSNEGSLSAANTSVVATLYDNDGNVIALGRAIVEPVNIPPGNQGSFGIAVVEKSQTHKTSSFSLVAYSDKYSSSPVRAQVASPSS